MKVKIQNTSDTVLTVVVNGTGYAFPKEDLEISRNGEKFTFAGLCGGEPLKLEVDRANITSPSSVSAAALLTALQAYDFDGPSMQRFTPLTGTTIAPVASTANRLAIIVEPAGTIAALTINLPILKDGQIVSLSTTQIVTALTLNAQSGDTIHAAPTATTTSFSQTWIYKAAQTKLYKI